LNKTELLKRSLTGIAIVGATLAMVIYSPYTYIIWLMLITFFGIGEYLHLELTKLNAELALFIQVIYSLLVGLSGYLLFHLEDPLFIISVLPVTMAGMILIQILTIQSPTELMQKGKSLFAGAVYICLPMLCGCIFLVPEYSFHFVLVPIITIWVNDIIAYLIGSIWGSKKIFPLISPGKSLQGTLGGALFTILLGFLFIRIWPELPRGYSLILGVFTPFFALGGDLWESALKRSAGVKDSGNILPGHGGILDRYDSLLFVLPVAALVYFIFVL